LLVILFAKIVKKYFANSVFAIFTPKNKKWARDDFPAQEASKLIKIRIWASAKKVEQAAELFVENAEGIRLKLLEKSEAYPCCPPNQNDTRIYLTFEDLEE
jgi:hypothetical protein